MTEIVHQAYCHCWEQCCGLSHLSKPQKSLFVFLLSLVILVDLLVFVLNLDMTPSYVLSACRSSKPRSFEHALSYIGYPSSVLSLGFLSTQQHVVCWTVPGSPALFI